MRCIGAWSGRSGPKSKVWFEPQIGFGARPVFDLNVSAASGRSSEPNRMFAIDRHLQVRPQFASLRGERVPQVPAVTSTKGVGVSAAPVATSPMARTTETCTDVGWPPPPPAAAADAGAAKAAG